MEKATRLNQGKQTYDERDDREEASEILIQDAQSLSSNREAPKAALKRCLEDIFERRFV